MTTQTTDVSLDEAKWPRRLQPMIGSSRKALKTISYVLCAPWIVLCLLALFLSVTCMVPRKRAAKRLPAVFFLHGNGGNFASYWQALWPLAAQHGFAVICPSFGFGNWSKTGGLQHIDAVISHATSRYQLDPQRTFLMGLSNGGTGVVPAVRRYPGRFRGVVLLSAIFGPEPLLLEGLARGAWRNLPVLVIHGVKDLRIPIETVTRGIEQIRQGGGLVTTKVLLQEDHFLFFARTPEVLGSVTHWIQQLSEELDKLRTTLE